MSYQVFISYSSKDKNIADAVCNHLESSGIACWIAPRDIKPGTEWATAIIDGISSCKIFLLLFTSNSDASPQVLREVERAISKDLVIIPLRLQNLLPTKSMEYYLSAVHWLDAFIPPHESHFNLIKNRIQTILDGQAASVANPFIPNKVSTPYSSGRYTSSGEMSSSKIKVTLKTDLFSAMPFIILEQDENKYFMIGKSNKDGDWFYETSDFDGHSGRVRISSMRMTDSIFKFNSNLEFRNNAIKRDYGPYTRHADFEDVRKFSLLIGSPQFIDLLGLRRVINPEIAPYDGVDYWNQGPFVTYKGAIAEGSRAYFISVHDGVLLDDWRIVDTIDNNNIDLGSWHNNRPILILYENDFAIERIDEVLKLTP